MTSASFNIRALVYAIVLTGINACNMNSNDWIRAKKMGAISCSPIEIIQSESCDDYALDNIKNGYPSIDNTMPAAPGERNNCAHMSGVAGLTCSHNDPKRRHHKGSRC